MSLQRTIKQLRREVTASPKKAAILGIMFFVAVYFWAPLVVGWSGKKKPGAGVKSTDPNAGLLPVVALQTAASPSNTTENQPSLFPWKLIDEWIEQDARTRSSPPRPAQRDPFHFREPRAEEVARTAAQPEPATAKEHLVADAAAMVLSGTIVGGGQRVAVINGKAYREGEQVKVVNRGESIVLKLVKIDLHRAVLEQDGIPIDVRMQPTPLAGEIEPIGP